MDIRNLEGEGECGETGGRWGLLEENGEVALVLKSYGPAVGNFKFDFQAEDLHIPIARDGPLADRDGEMVEPEHGASSMGRWPGMIKGRSGGN